MANKALLDAIASDFARDTSKEVKGAWMIYGKRRYLIARAHRNNVAFQKMMEVEMRPYQWAIERGNLDALKDVTNTVLQKVYASTILIAIENLPVPATKDSPALPATSLDYTPADGVMLFEALPDFWDSVFKFAESGRNYALDHGYNPDEVKDDSKN